jgi:hypothetical protein
MSLQLIFWILMLIWLIFGVVSQTGYIAGPYGFWGNTLLIFILFLILGWKVFGSPVQGG